MIRTKFPLICGFFIISTMFAVPVFRSGPAMYTIMQAGSPDLSEITILSVSILLLLAASLVSCKNFTKMANAESWISAFGVAIVIVYEILKGQQMIVTGMTALLIGYALMIYQINIIPAAERETRIFKKAIRDLLGKY